MFTPKLYVKVVDDEKNFRDHSSEFFVEWECLCFKTQQLFRTWI